MFEIYLATVKHKTVLELVESNIQMFFDAGIKILKISLCLIFIISTYWGGQQIQPHLEVMG